MFLLNTKHFLMKNTEHFMTIVRTFSSLPITNLGLFTEVSPPRKHAEEIVTIVGVGNVGKACAFNLLTREISANIVLVDKETNKLMGETLDLQHGSLFSNTQVYASPNYEDTANSKICLITAGVTRSSTTQTRLSLAKENIEIFKSIIPKVLEYSPKVILIIISNPVDILTWAAWKISGLPTSRVIGTGTDIDTARFQFLISEKVGVPPNNCYGYVIGAHDLDQVPVWSNVDIGGVRLRDLNPKAGTADDEEKWKEVHDRVLGTPQEIIKLKGNTCWTIAFSVGSIVKSILKNTSSIHTVTTNIKGFHGVTFDVFLSLPCVLNNSGIHKIVKQPLKDDERTKLLKTAESHNNFMKTLQL